MKIDIIGHQDPYALNGMEGLEYSMEVPAEEILFDVNQGMRLPAVSARKLKYFKKATDSGRPQYEFAGVI